MQRMMIGAVARAYNPGCSMSWLPILVGAQGVGKSMFSRNLVLMIVLLRFNTSRHIDERAVQAARGLAT
jgi:predicted kinase